MKYHIMLHFIKQGLRIMGLFLKKLVFQLKSNFKQKNRKMAIKELLNLLKIIGIRKIIKDFKKVQMDFYYQLIKLGTHKIESVQRSTDSKIKITKSNQKSLDQEIPVQEERFVSPVKQNMTIFTPSQNQFIKYRNRVIRITGSLDIKQNIQTFFQTQPNKSTEDVRKKEEKSLDQRNNESDDDINLKELMKKDCEWIEKSEKLIKQNKCSYASQRLQPLVQTSSPNQHTYHKYFKEQDRMKNFQELYDLKSNIYGKMNDKIIEKDIMPRQLGLMSATSEQHIKADSIFGSKKYMELFAEGISSNTFKQLKSISLQSNSLTGDKLDEIIKKLPSSLQEIDLSQNKIDKIGIMPLTEFLKYKQSNLKKLILENNKLGDVGTICILDALMDHRSLQYLNLSMNQISDRSMDILSRLLRKSSSLLELYLHYNQITPRGGILLFRGLQKNLYLKVLDVSFNKMGSKTKNELPITIANTLGKPHPELLHLDLSYNNFEIEESKIIAEHIIFNQQLYGFHFEGNASGWTVNSRGYLTDSSNKHLIKKLIPTQSQNECTSQSNDLLLQQKIKSIEKSNQNYQIPKLFRRISSVETIGIRKEAYAHNFDVCWICEGWQEVKFQWTPGKSGTLNMPPIFLHLDFENYKPIIMSQETEYFFLYRMCPPLTKITYFFSNPIENVQLYAKDQKILNLKEGSDLFLHGVPLFYADGTFTQSSTMSIVNFLITNSSIPVIDSKKHYIPNVFSRPRENEKVYDIDPQIAKKRIWSIENSIFKDYQPDTDGHLQECFDYDFECGKLAKHYKTDNQLEELKETMLNVYKHILASYKYYAALTLNYEFPLISQQFFQAFISQTTIMQKKLMNNIDLDLSYLSAYIIPRDAEYHYVQEKCLVRYQFLEIIIRIAKEQYMKTNICQTIGQAVARLFQEDGVLYWVRQFGVAQLWRDERYWLQIVDMTLQHKLPFLKALFDYTIKFSQKKHASYKYISPQDFNSLIQQALPGMIKEQEVYLIFLQSQMTQVDELLELRHVQMTFIEFLEGLARVAEKISPSSPKFKEKNLNQQKRHVLPLFVKLEGLFYIFYHRLKFNLNEVQINPSLVSTSILQTRQARNFGLFEQEKSSSEDDSKSKESEIEEEDPELMIQKQLFYQEEVEQQLPRKQSPKKLIGSQKKILLRKMTYESEPIKEKNPSMKKIVYKNDIKKELESFQSSNIMKKIENEQKHVDLIEQGEYEESTPVHRMKLEQQKKLRQKYSNAKLIHQPTYNFEEQVEKLY